MANLQAIDLGLNIGNLEIFRNVSLELQPGKIVCLLGTSGCGKTSLIRILAGLACPSSGSVRRNFALGCAVGFQEQEALLLPWLSVSDNITFKSKLLPHSRDNRAQLDYLLDLAELAHLSKRYPDQLSGGERQRVCLLRSLWGRPEVLFLDEPFSKLDPDLRLRIGGRLSQHIRSQQLATLIVTHSFEEAASIADRVMYMSGLPASIQYDRIIGGQTEQERSSALLSLVAWNRSVCQDMSGRAQGKLCSAS